MSDIFVFGSNLAGIHGAGAARHAFDRHGAIWGEGIGRHGDSYAIPTKDRKIVSLSTTAIRMFVDDFIKYAIDNQNLTFKVTQIGCGLAGFTAADIAPMFILSPKNCQFDTDWRDILGDKYTYWGNVK